MEERKEFDRPEHPWSTQKTPSDMGISMLVGISFLWEKRNGDARVVIFLIYRVSDPSKIDQVQQRAKRTTTKTNCFVSNDARMR
jgi:hypothetical protein